MRRARYDQGRLTVTDKEDGHGGLVLDRRKVEVLLYVCEPGAGNVLAIEVVEDIHDDEDGHDDHVHLERCPLAQSVVVLGAHGRQGRWHREGGDGGIVAELGVLDLLRGLVPLLGGVGTGVVAGHVVRRVLTVCG